MQEFMKIIIQLYNKTSSSYVVRSSLFRQDKLSKIMLEHLIDQAL
jgi:hypothetical protein